MPTFDPVAGTPKFPLFPPQSNPQVARELLSRMLGVDPRAGGAPAVLHGPWQSELRSAGIGPMGGAQMPPMVRSEELFQRALPAAGQTSAGLPTIYGPPVAAASTHPNAAWARAGAAPGEVIPGKVTYPIRPRIGIAETGPPVPPIYGPERPPPPLELNPAPTAAPPSGATYRPALTDAQEYGPFQPFASPAGPQPRGALPPGSGRAYDVGPMTAPETLADLRPTYGPGNVRGIAEFKSSSPGVASSANGFIADAEGAVSPALFSSKYGDAVNALHGPMNPDTGFIGGQPFAEKIGAPVNQMHGPVNPETNMIGGLAKAEKAGNGLLDKLLWRGPREAMGALGENAGGLANAKIIGKELLGRSMYALPISMVGQAIENRYDQYNSHDNPLVNALAGASRGGAAGAMIGGPWGALIGAGIGGGANLLTGGGAEDVFDSIPLVGDFLGGGGASRESKAKVDQARGAGLLNEGEGLKQYEDRNAKYQMAQTMGLTPDLAAQYAFGDTPGYAKMQAILGAQTDTSAQDDAAIIDAMAKYMQVPMENLTNLANNQVAELASAAPGYAGSVASVAPMMQQAANAQAAAMMQQALIAPFNVQNAKGQRAYTQAQGFNQGYSQANRYAKNTGTGGGGGDLFSAMLQSVGGGQG